MIHYNLVIDNGELVCGNASKWKRFDNLLGNAGNELHKTIQNDQQTLKTVFLNPKNE